MALDRALRGADPTTGEPAAKPATLGEALQAYENDRRAEHRALIRLARFGAPYQYKQPWYRHRIGKFFWTANVAFRLLLNKLTLGLVPPAAIIMMIERPDLSFRQIMRRADTASLVFKGMLIGIALCVGHAKRLLLAA